MAFQASKKTYSLNRALDQGGKVYYQFVGNVYIFVQPLDTEYQLNDESFSKTFKGFADLNIDIKVDDKIYLEASDIKYKVAGVSRMDFGRLKHTELILNKLEQDG